MAMGLPSYGLPGSCFGVMIVTQDVVVYEGGVWGVAFRSFAGRGTRLTRDIHCFAVEIASPTSGSRPVFETVPSAARFRSSERVPETSPFGLNEGWARGAAKNKVVPAERAPMSPDPRVWRTPLNRAEKRDLLAPRTAGAVGCVLTNCATHALPRPPRKLQCLLIRHQPSDMDFVANRT